jgi:uncharacterized protein (DUF58 family)
MATAMLHDVYMDPARSSGYELTRKRVYILPSRAGWMFAGCLGVMLLGAINYNNSLAYALTFLLGALVLVSVLHTYRNQAALVIHSGHTSSVHAGDIGAFDVEIRNATGLARVGIMVRYGDIARKRGAKHEDHDASRPVLIRTNVGAHDSVRLTFPVTSRARGLLALGTVTVSTRYPFGLFRAWSDVRLSTNMLVYPALNGEVGLPAHRADGAGEGGGGRNGAEDFAGLRPYRPGDSPRLVHWKAAARSLQLPVKEMVGGGSADLLLDWQETAGGTETRLSQLASRAVAAERQGCRYALNLPGTSISVGAGSAHLDRCLTAMALYRLAPPYPESA